MVIQALRTDIVLIHVQQFLLFINMINNFGFLLCYSRYLYCFTFYISILKRYFDVYKLYEEMKHSIGIANSEKIKRLTINSMYLVSKHLNIDPFTSQLETFSCILLLKKRTRVSDVQRHQ